MRRVQDYGGIVREPRVRDEALRFFSSLISGCSVCAFLRVLLFTPTCVDAWA